MNYGGMKHNFRCEQIVYNTQVLCRRYVGSYMVPSTEIVGSYL